MSNKFKALSNFEIDDFFSKLPKCKYGGCYALDELPENIQNKHYICNLDTSDKDGSHWVLISNNNPDYCAYFDSFGRECPDEIEKFMRGSKKTCIRNQCSIQNIFSEICGFYCMLFIVDQDMKGKQFTDCVYEYDLHNTNDNDDMVENRFSNT